MSLRVLLADQNIAVQKLVELTLQNAGIDVTSTDNNLSALDIALKKTPDLILADFNLEGFDLFTFVQKIRQTPRLSHVPIILLINATETFDPERLQSAGVQAFFKKPLDAQELLGEIKKLTGDVIQGSRHPGTSSGTEPGTLPGLESQDRSSNLSRNFSEVNSEATKMEAALGWSADEETVVAPPIPRETLGAQQKMDPLQINESLLNQAVQQQVQASIEKITADILPELLRSTISKEVVTPILEKVAWEVVAPIAETEIKKEIVRLQAEE